jgi:hypothetical protein
MDRPSMCLFAVMNACHRAVTVVTPLQTGPAIQAALSYLAQVQSMIIRQKVRSAAAPPFCDELAKFRSDTALTRRSGAMAGRDHWLRAAQQVRLLSTHAAVQLCLIPPPRQVQGDG